ncbi:MAG: RNA-binding transcriptional accessory protein, partial [Anaerolineae bacterium]|nr:RNA-binding transcriptional accessory protein [Anaerolineae bacterium]
MTRNYDSKIASLLSVQANQVAATIRLLDEGNTIPFIARYRKEQTLNLDEFKIRQIEETVQKFRQVDDRRETILKTVEEQGQLTPELREKIDEAESITELEDLYAPYKPKRRTRAGIARERGLEPLAQMILKQSRKGDAPEVAAKAFITEEVPTIEDALQGARDIVAEQISDDAEVRGELREKANQFSTLTSTRIKDSEDPKGTYETYYQFEGRVAYLRPHQVLAMNRGENEKVLRIKVDVPERDWRNAIEYRYRVDARSAWAGQLQEAIEDSAKRLLLPAMERDVRRTLSDAAELHAIQVFAENLRALLNQPPLRQRIVM